METGARAIYTLFDAFCAPSAVEGEALLPNLVFLRVFFVKCLLHFYRYFTQTDYPEIARVKSVRQFSESRACFGSDVTFTRYFTRNP